MTVSDRWNRPIRTWTWLAAGVSALTACVGRPSGDPPPRDDPDTRIAAETGGVGSRFASTSGTSTAHLSSDRIQTVVLTTGSASRPDSAMAGALESVPVLDDRDTDAPRSFLIPAIEIVSFEALLNQYDRHWGDHDTYATDGESIRRNLHRGWVIDKDGFSMNQFGHPYSGSIYHGFARSAGLNYWQSLGYDFAGAALWEVAGETDPPSLNDQITTTFAGSFLGEALFRTANLLLGSGDGRPGPYRTAGAALISPSSAFNRFAFDDRFAASYPDDDPALFYSFGVGARQNTTLDEPGALTNLAKNQAVATFALDYGLPGKPDYTYTKPFDYYHLEATATSSLNAFPESIVVRGLLAGSEYSSGPDYRGIWGLYGSYDYLSPEIFKVSSTGLSLGTTGQVLMSDRVALQGTLMGGVGLTAAGNNADSRRDRQYRYGASPQALLALRLIYSDVAMLDLSANDYLMTGGVGSSDTSGNENIFRAQLSLTVRVYGGHAIGIQFVESSRDPRFSAIPNLRQSVGALNLFYTFLSDEHFGVVRQ